MLTSGTRSIYPYLYIAEESIPHAKFDINPFGEHNKTDSRPDDTDENIPLPPITPGGGSTWEPECEQETSFGGRMSLGGEVLRE